MALLLFRTTRVHMAEASYSKLDPRPVRSTMEVLRDRIGERFPGSGLSRVAAELVSLAQQNETVLVNLRRPIWWLRALTLIALAALIALAVWVAVSLSQVADARTASLSDALQAVDAAINELIFLSLAVFFLISIEIRFKRTAALRMLHRFRSLAHIVDMHQLTKDPEHVLHAVSPTESSPKRQLTRGELTRYLDYCAELLALVSKLAALHAQDLQDAVVLEAVNDLESLTAGLAQKVWQKIMILDITAPRREEPRRPRPS